jgi:hypothetical protein
MINLPVGAFRCEYPNGCVNKQQYDRKYIRKSVSDCFGRNKKCTHRIENPIIWCRSHYQQQAYHKIKWITQRIELVKIQLMRNERQENGLRYTIVLLKSECNRVNSLVNGDGDLLLRPSKNLRGQPYRAPSWALLQILERFIGEDRTQKECEELLAWIKKHAAEGHLKSFPEVELLPKWNGHEKEIGTSKEQIGLIELAKTYEGGNAYDSDDLPQDHEPVQKQKKSSSRSMLKVEPEKSNSAAFDYYQLSPGEDAGNEESDCTMTDNDAANSDDEVDVDEPKPKPTKKGHQMLPNKLPVTKAAHPKTGIDASLNANGKRRVKNSRYSEDLRQEWDDPSDEGPIDTPHKKPRLTNTDGPIFIAKKELEKLRKLAETNPDAADILEAILSYSGYPEGSDHVN